MKHYAFGVDIGGTAIKTGLFDTRGELLHDWEIPTRLEEKGKYILPDIAEFLKKKLVAQHLSIDVVEGIGIGVPGPVTHDGTVIRCVNLGWGVLNIEEELKNLTGLRVKAGNDANLAAMGEMWQGGGKGYKDVVMVTLGTGIGGGIIIDGKLVAGAHGAGGEIGHLLMNTDEMETCGCGATGHLEQYASAPGIVKEAKKQLAVTDMPSRLRDIEEELDSRHIFDAAGNGDLFSLDILNYFGRTLGQALSQISCVCDPEIFVIGGGVSKAGSIVIDTVRKYFLQFAFHSNTDTRFALATLGNKAGMYGGVKVLLDS